MNRDDRSAFALRLRTLRKAAHLTQGDVAEKLNIHRTAYTKYETDRANPDKTCLLMLAELFGVSVDELLGKEPTMTAFLQDSAASETVVGLTSREQELLSTFRRLTTEQQDQLLRDGREYEQKNRDQ